MGRMKDKMIELTEGLMWLLNVDYDDPEDWDDAFMNIQEILMTSDTGADALVKIAKEYRV